MKLIDAYAKIKDLNIKFFYTNDISTYLKIEPSHASKVLKRLEESKLLINLSRGLWIFANSVDRLTLPSILTSPFPTYISLQTALYYHGMISQIPDTIYAVSLARTHLFKTVCGAVSIHHIQTDFFFGFENTENSLIKMATPEKALIDYLYLADTKSKLFTALPEIELTKKFTLSKAKKIIDKIPSLRKRTLVKSQLGRLQELLE